MASNSTEIQIVFTADGTAVIGTMDGIDKALKKTKDQVKNTGGVIEVSRRDFRGLTVDALGSAGAFNGMSGAGRITSTVLQLVDTRALSAGRGFSALGASIKATIASLGPVGIAITVVSLALQALNAYGEAQLKKAEAALAKAEALSAAAVERNAKLRKDREDAKKKEEEEYKAYVDLLKANEKIEADHAAARDKIMEDQVAMERRYNAELKAVRAQLDSGTGAGALSAEEQAAVNARMEFLDAMARDELDGAAQLRYDLLAEEEKKIDELYPLQERGVIISEELEARKAQIAEYYANQRANIESDLQKNLAKTYTAAQAAASYAVKAGWASQEKIARAEAGVDALKYGYKAIAAWAKGFGGNPMAFVEASFYTAASLAAAKVALSGTAAPSVAGGGAPGATLPADGGGDNKTYSQVQNVYVYGSLWQTDQLARDLVPALAKASADGVR